MEQRVSLVTLAVSDLAQSRRFYEEGLGWKASFTSEDIAFYQVPGGVFALWSKKAMAADLGKSQASLGSGAIQLAHNVRDQVSVDQTLAEAQAAGARILKPAHDAIWGGYTGLFADPDGHSWEVAWNPDWKMAPNGTVSLT